MKRVFSGLIDLADRLVGQAGRMAAWLGLAMVLLVAFGVLARYLFAFGFVWLQELEWHLLAVTALIGMSYTLHRGDEVRVDILYAYMGPRMKTLVRLLSALLTLAVAVIIVKLSLPYVSQSRAMGEGSPDPGGLPHRFVLKGFIPLGFALLGLQALVQIRRLIVELRALSSRQSRPRGAEHGD
ncbi:MAG: TRAP transporter small permease subunit [Dichotomicrobium sp.]